MKAVIEYLSNKASAAEIAEHLSNCDADFVPTLSGRVEISDYANKIASKAERFEAWSDGTLVGLVAAYCNDQQTHLAYITSVSVLKAWMGKGIASKLMKLCIGYAKASGMQQISLEVARTNVPAISLYKQIGFAADRMNASFVTMHLHLAGEDCEQ